MDLYNNIPAWSTFILLYWRDKKNNYVEYAGSFKHLEPLHTCKGNSRVFAVFPNFGKKKQLEETGRGEEEEEEDEEAEE